MLPLQGRPALGAGHLRWLLTEDKGTLGMSLVPRKDVGGQGRPPSSLSDVPGKGLRGEGREEGYLRPRPASVHRELCDLGQVT